MSVTPTLQNRYLNNAIRIRVLRITLDTYIIWHTPSFLMILWRSGSVRTSKAYHVLINFFTKDSIDEECEYKQDGSILSAVSTISEKTDYFRVYANSSFQLVNVLFFNQFQVKVQLKTEKILTFKKNLNFKQYK